MYSVPSIYQQTTQFYSSSLKKPNCVYISHFKNQLICAASELCLKLGYYKYFCNKHGYASDSNIFWSTFFWRYAHEVSVDHMTTLVSAFCGTSILISAVFALTYTPTNSVEVFLFHTSLPEFVVVCVIHDSQFDWGEVEPQFFSFAFPVYSKRC
jgi:hypothetical protein